MGLRINEGISLARFGKVGEQALDKEIIGGFVSDDLLVCENDSLRVTDKGRLVLNHITEKLLIG